MSDFALDLTPAGSLTVACVVNGPVQTNTFFAISGGEAIVIDPAWEGEKLADWFEESYPGVRVAALVCTHGHADHVGGVCGMRAKLPDVPYLLPADDAAQVRASILGQRLGWAIDTPDPGEPTRLLHEGDAIEFGDVRIQMFSVPGHTPGGMIYFCASETGNVAFVGDTLFPGSHGRTDLAGGDQPAIERSLARMNTLLPADTLCHPGHGPSTTIARERMLNPFFS